MNKTSKTNFVIGTFFLLVFLQVIFAQFVVAQPTVNLSFSNSKATITTTVDEMNAGESSVGLFYRMEHATGTAFWWDTLTVANSTVSNNKATMTRTLAGIFPGGDYRLTVYQARKGGPIRPGSSGLVVNNDFSCRGCILPQSAPSTSLMKLSPSWNVFTDAQLTTYADPHYTSNTAATPQTPWLFLALTVNNWTASGTYIIVKYNDQHFDYADAIVNNHLSDQNANAANMVWLNNIIPQANGELLIKTSTLAPQNQQTQVLLIFKRDPSGALDAALTTDFKAVYYQYDVPIDNVSVALPVKPKPHDPNSLVVDKNALCPCWSGEKLTYTINFQNKGNGPARSVKIRFLQTQSLLPATVKIIEPSNNTAASSGHTYLKQANVVYDAVTQTFEIANINLPGSAQTAPQVYDYWETADYIRFVVDKQDCLSVGTVIAPMAEIIFYDSPNFVNPEPEILTNLEKTVLSNNTIIDGKKCNEYQMPPCRNCRSIPIGTGGPRKRE